MEKFFVDNCTVDNVNAAYIGKNMQEISKLEKQYQKQIQPEVDSKHNAFFKDNRSSMLTVQKLIDYLMTQDPNACILAYEPNSFAYIEQQPSLPNDDICTVAEDKIKQENYLQQWYKNDPNAAQKIKEEIDMTYRYANDNDIVIKFN